MSHCEERHEKETPHEIEFIIDLTAKGFNLTLKHEISILAGEA